MDGWFMLGNGDLGSWFLDTPCWAGLTKGPLVLLEMLFQAYILLFYLLIDIVCWFFSSQDLDDYWVTRCCCAWCQLRSLNTQNLEVGIGNFWRAFHMDSMIDAVCSMSEFECTTNRLQLWLQISHVKYTVGEFLAQRLKLIDLVFQIWICIEAPFLGL